MTTMTRGIVAALVVCGIGSCTFAGKSPMHHQCKSVNRDFFFEDRSPSGQIEKFRAKSLPEQYQIYLCGIHTIHPPALYLAEPLAQGGAPTASFLGAKLSESPSDVTVFGVLIVLEQMERDGTYGVTGDEELIDTITNAIVTMEDEAWRAAAEEVFDQITGSVKKAVE